MSAPLRLAVQRTEVTTGSEVGVRIALTMPSDLGLVEQVVDLVARHCLAVGLAPRRVRFHLRTALAEALANAIVYGNRLDPHKAVTVRLESGSQAIELHVADEGDGFDPAALPDPTAPDRVGSEDGRGLFLIRCLVDDLRFNQKGNALCMTLRRT